MSKKSKFQQIWNRNPKNPRSLLVLARRFLEWLTARNYSQGTIYARRYYLGFFFTWCDEYGITTIERVTRDIIDRYQKYLCNHYSEKCKGILPASSRRLHLMNVCLFFNWLIKQQLIVSNPTSIVEIPKPPEHLPRNVLTQEEVEAILSQVDLKKPRGIRDRTIMETFYSTGIRAQELIQLKVTDLDIERGTLLVRQGKGKKDRVVPIGERAIKWIEKYLLEVRPCELKKNDEGTLFLTQYGKPFSSHQGLICQIYPYIKATGKTGGCHIFRHAMATLMLENGASTRYLQEILGHRDITTTEIYTKVTINKLRQVHTLTHPAEINWQPPE